MAKKDKRRVIPISPETLSRIEEYHPGNYPEYFEGEPNGTTLEETLTPEQRDKVQELKDGYDYKYPSNNKRFKFSLNWWKGVGILIAGASAVVVGYCVYMVL